MCHLLNRHIQNNTSKFCLNTAHYVKFPKRIASLSLSAKSSSSCSIKQERSFFSWPLMREFPTSFFVVFLKNLVSLYNLLYSPSNTGMIAYVKSSFKTPPSFTPQYLDKSIPNPAGISATTTSIMILLAGIQARDTTMSLTSPTHFTILNRMNIGFYRA